MKKPETNPNPLPIDDNEDRMGGMKELDFNDELFHGKDRGERTEEDYEGQFPPERVSEAGMTEGETVDHHVTMDDLTPETLLDDTGARNPEEYGDAWPVDKELTVVDSSDIGGGVGMDEAEMGRTLPLDGEAWDGNADEPNETDVRRAEKSADLDATDQDITQPADDFDLNEKKPGH
ncbi:hypothetical protein IQ22_01994 [Pseudomonas duriflava]|uniref:Phosphotransferase system, HPr-related protein n=1 Tax=Pseudomonas duriflava TaxID=459528 RepID=A0A562QED0_9PSED|nr:hypothetical protein [Pseudomonas duriflava]TWI55081.1 hypothetical protein IQ22_01994 [Pseudomonas duriflava]